MKRLLIVAMAFLLLAQIVVPAVFAAELVSVEVVASTPNAIVVVEQGETVNFEIDLTATGSIGGAFTASNPNKAAIDTVYSIVGTSVSTSMPSADYDFYASSTPQGGGYLVTWKDAPTPYKVTASASASPTTPTGDYQFIRIDAAISNPSGQGGKLGDGTADYLTIRVVKPSDTTPPVITPTITGTLGDNGWYISNVGVTWSVTDPESTITSTNGATPTTITTDTTGTTLTCTATSAGGSSSKSVTIKRDATPPTISGAATTHPNANGWYKDDVTVEFTAGDAISGVASPPPDVTLTGDGAAQSATGTVTDKAGNTASATVSGINIDKTAPDISYVRDPKPNAYGWNNGPVTVTFTAEDPLSGVALVSDPVTVSAEKANQEVSGTATDKAGNTASVTVDNINIDKTAPTISGAASPAPNAKGWNNGPVTVTFTAGDALSGVDSVTDPATLSSDGAGQSVTGTVTDKAGNEASTTVSGINIDTTVPTITYERNPLPNANGWNNVDVTVKFSATDGLSGVDSVSPEEKIFSTEGADQSVTGTVTDEAGNIASVTVDNINIDKTPPTISGAATTSPNANGWYKDDVNVAFDASDALSGLVPQPASETLSNEGAGQSATGTVTDKAGNTASATVAGINIDKTAPIINSVLNPEPNSYGWNNGPVTVTFTAVDPLSDVASVSDPVTISTEGANQKISGTATDKAGNTAPRTVTINIDLTKPTISGAASPASNAKGWNNGPVTVTFTAGDALSGLVSQPASETLSDEGAGQSATGTVTDKAGNTASATVAGINIDTTAPTITYERNPLPNANGWNKVDVTVKFAATDGLSGVDSVSPAEKTFSTEGAGQSVTGTATDKAGNSVSVTVDKINIDKTAPTITAPVDQTIEGNTIGGASGFTLGTPIVSDFLDANPTVSKDAPALFPLGKTIVTWTATDKAGNSATDTQTITIKDTTPPDITAPAAITVEGNTIGGAIVSESILGTATASDIVDASPIVTNNAPSKFPLGTTTVTWTATDHSGNSKTATQTVTVKDTTPPTITAPATLSVLVNAPKSVLTGSATDLVDANPSLTNNAPSVFPVGKTTVTWTATDASGNIAHATTVVTANYNIVGTGFLQPIDMDGGSIFKLGSTVPTKFQLKDYNGNYVSTAVANLLIAKYSNNVVGDDIEAVSTSAATTGTLFRYDASANQYIYNLGTKAKQYQDVSLVPGSYQIKAVLDSGQDIHVIISLK